MGAWNSLVTFPKDRKEHAVGAAQSSRVAGRVTTRNARHLDCCQRLERDRRLATTLGMPGMFAQMTLQLTVKVPSPVLGMAYCRVDEGQGAWALKGG